MGRNKITFCKGHTINKGRVLTPEHKEKIRQGMLKSQEEGKPIGRAKGSIPWNKGLNNANDGKPASDKTKKKISKSLTGRSLSKDHKEKVSRSLRGRHCSPRTEFKNGMTSPRKGVVLSEETKKKISKSRKGKYLSAEAIKKALTRRTPSSLELKFQEIVDTLGLPYKFVGNGSFMIGRKNPDFVNVNGQKIAIEVYARYYKRRHAETIEEWKEERTRVFAEYGWQIIFFDETQVNKKTILKKIKQEELQWLR